MRRTLLTTVSATASAVLAAGVMAVPAAAATDDGFPMLDIAHSTAGGLNLWEIPLGVEAEDIGEPFLVRSVTGGGFSYAASRTASGEFGDVTPQDDGTPDWLISHAQPNGGVLLWVVGGGEDTTPRIWADLRGGGWSWADSRQYVADVDADGLDDVVSVHRNPQRTGLVGANVWVHRNTGTGFAAPVLWQSIPAIETGWQKSLQPFTDIRYLVGEVSGDGLPDLVTINSADGRGGDNSAMRYRIWPNNGGGFTSTGFFTSVPKEQGWSFQGSRHLLADVDGDGNGELLTVHSQPGGGVLVWVHSSGSIAFGENPALMADLRTGGWSFAHSRQVAADVDGDGADDLVTVHHQPGGGILLWAHRTASWNSAEAPEILSDLREGGWAYASSRETVGYVH